MPNTTQIMALGSRNRNVNITTVVAIVMTITIMTLTVNIGVVTSLTIVTSITNQLLVIRCIISIIFYYNYVGTCTLVADRWILCASF